MRLRQRDLVTVYIRPRASSADAEGKISEGYGTAVALKGSISPHSASLEARIHGQKVKEALSLRVENLTGASPGDGVCLYVSGSSDPDYTITAIQPRWDISLIEIERR